MARRAGCPRGGRRRVMWFVLWAQKLDRCPTPSEIAQQLDVGLETARHWRQDWLLVRGLPIARTPAEGSAPCATH